MLKIIVSVIVSIILLGLLAFQIVGLVKDIRQRKTKKNDNNNGTLNDKK